MADMLAKKGAESTPTPPPYAEFNPTSLLKHSARLHIEDKWNKRWNSLNTCEHSKSMLSTVKIRNTLPASTKPQLCNLVEMITNHNLFGYHANKWQKHLTLFCRLCEEGVESTYHIVHECPDLELYRMTFNTLYEDTRDGYYSQLLAFYDLPQVQKMRLFNAEEISTCTCGRTRTRP